MLIEKRDKKTLQFLKIMKAKIFVVEFPTFEDVVEKISSFIDEAFDVKPKAKKCERKETVETTCDFTPKKFKVKDRFGRTPNGAWGVCGTPADENLRFGYGLQVDEPREEEFHDWDDFLEAREAFDDFVESGERCVELGLEKKNDAPIHKCNAIRKPIGCPPPMRDEVPNGDLIGESQFPWWKDKSILDWNF